MSAMQDMTKGGAAGHLLRYAVPLMLGNWFQLAYNAVDSIIAGRFIGKDALAAEGIAGPVMNLVILGNKAPLGILPPNSVYFSGFLRNATISSTSCLASDKPATSLNVTFRSLSLSKSCAFALPTLNTPPGPPPAPPDILLIRKIHTTMIRMIGPKETKKFHMASSPSSYRT